MNKELPKAYNPSEYEDGIYKKWEKSGYFNPDNLDLPEKSKNYSIVMPPPNVTGVLHMGSAMMLAVQDVLIRYHRMKGERALWLPGTDHAAIATQARVEKNLKKQGLDRHILGRKEFLKRVNKFAQESHDVIIKQIKKMGSSCDWSREAYTLDETRHKAVYSVFKMMHDDGLIYRGERIVNWCPRCHSTLADDEVEYKEQKAKLYTFKYSKDFPFTIATTRPETKLGDTAVAVNPKDKRYKKYIGKVYEVDFCGIKLKLKVIADRHVEMDFGTGALGVTPAHSMADWQMAEKNDLEVIKVINEDGKINNNFQEYSGKTVKEAREMIVEKLRKNNLLEKEEEVDNSLSVCYRCSTPIEPLPSLQWFIDVNKKIPKYKKSIKELSVEAVQNGVFGREKIKIYPKRFEKNYFHWMNDLRDWCISRQIWFGHRIPVWYKRITHNAQRITHNNEEKIYVGVEAPEGKGWIQDEDTLDTWFSSGLWTFSTLANNSDQIKIKDGKLIIDSDDFKKFHPTAVLETMYDILFFWVARMIIMTTYAVGYIPFQDVYLHGCVRDKNGDKMSKSKPKTCIDPIDVCDKYGTDAVRLSLVIGTSPGNDMNLSEEKIAGFRNLVNKIWNISRYVIGNLKLEISNLEKKDTECPIGHSVSAATLADEWILNKLESLIKEVGDDLDNYQFSQAGEKLRDFTWNDFADWYLEISKFEKSKEKEQTLFYVLKNLLKLWHPFIPFVTEKIWGEINKDKMLMIEDWPSTPHPPAPSPKQEMGSNNPPSCLGGAGGGINGGAGGGINGGAGGGIIISNNFELIKDIITAIRNARAENKIEPAKKIKAIIYSKKHAELIKSQEHLIKNLRTGIKELNIVGTGHCPVPTDAIHISVADVEIYLINVVDKEKEKIRIKKEIENLKQLIIRTEKKLSNKQFAERAPEKIVKQEKEKLELWKEELKKIKG